MEEVMTYDYHLVFGIAAGVIGIVSFAPYFRDILNRSTKPHIFTWIVWSLLTGLVFLIQLSEGSGPGAWVTGLESACCIGVLAFAFTRGEKNITRIDWVCFVAALLATILWLLAHQPLLAVFLIICADFLGYGPTFRKSYTKPNEETATLYALSSVHWLFSIVALQSLAPVNWLYPGVISVIDIALVTELLVRRRQLASALDNKTTPASL